MYQHIAETIAHIINNLKNFFFRILSFIAKINKYINKIHVPYKGIIDKYFNFLFIIRTPLVLYNQKLREISKPTPAAAPILIPLEKSKDNPQP